MSSANNSENEMSSVEAAHSTTSSYDDEGKAHIAIMYCWISSIGAIILHPFGKSAKQSEAHMPKGCNFFAPQALIQ